MHWLTITQFGDAAIMGPLALMLLLWFIVNRCRREAVVWAAVAATVLLVVSTSKIAFIGWGLGLPAWTFREFSGHTALSALVLPVALFLLFRRGGVVTGSLGGALGLVLAALIGISRLKLGLHSPSEVVTGWMLGASGSLVFLGAGHTGIRPSLGSNALLAALLVVGLVAAQGRSAPSQRILTVIARHLSGHAVSAEVVGRHSG